MLIGYRIQIGGCDFRFQFTAAAFVGILAMVCTQIAIIHLFLFFIRWIGWAALIRCPKHRRQCLLDVRRPSMPLHPLYFSTLNSHAHTHSLDPITSLILLMFFFLPLCVYVLSFLVFFFFVFLFSSLFLFYRSRLLYSVVSFMVTHKPLFLCKHSI